MRLLKDKRFQITLSITLVVAGYFWTQSRVPALNEKASMGSEVHINALGFESIVVSSPNDPLWRRVGVETINWAQTNRKGMAFGVVFGGLMMTLFGIVGHRRYKSVFANSAVGTLIGAPLGVCVNCAAPIAAGMVSAGARLETTVSAMMSSPTLNVIVLSMLFALFPIHLALLKLGLTLATVLLAVPLLTRHVFKRESATLEAASAACELPQSVAHVDGHDNWLGAATWVLKHASKNLWYVFSRTVPLMLVAGLLGAVMITVLPWETLVKPFDSNSNTIVLLSMGIIALVGTFLPVPMSFDVIVCAVLLAAGMPVKYVAVLLCTLGIFSIYSYFIVWRTISPRAANVMYATVAVLGVVAGITGHFTDRWLIERDRRLVVSTILERKSGPEPRPRVPEGGLPPEVGAETILPTLQQAAFTTAAVSGATGVHVLASSLASPSVAGDRLFTRHDGARFGIDLPLDMHFSKLMPPFETLGTAIASGDVHNDGAHDLLVTHGGQLHLYANSGGRFTAQRVDVPLLDSTIVLNAALADIDGDGWLDLYFSTYGRGAWLVHNDGGRFTAAAASRLPGMEGTVLAATVGFGDVDRDGRLDIVLGRWELAFPGIRATARSTPVLLLNRGSSFETRELPAPAGQAMVVLLTDFNSDGFLDIVVGNDFSSSDYFMRGDGTGHFTTVQRSDGMIPTTTLHTMSIASADLDNDLRPEMYLGAIARYSDKDKAHPIKDPPAICDELASSTQRATCSADMAARQLFASTKFNSTHCTRIKAADLRVECLLFGAIKEPDTFSREELCVRFPPSWNHLALMCESFRARSIPHAPRKFPEDLPQVEEGNVLLAPTGSAKFTQRQDELGLKHAGWTWNAKFADLDNDGWVDLYAANGWFASNKRQESNYFYRNEQGKHFSEETEKSGLGTYFPTMAYSYIDIDSDGDLDVVTVPAYGPVWVFVNNTQRANALDVELRDRGGNVFGVGAKVTVYAGRDGTQRQMRELQLSGGYMSFDAPVLHFGLGDNATVSRIDVAWPDGTSSSLKGPFHGRQRYRIVRGGGSPRRESGPMVASLTRP